MDALSPARQSAALALGECEADGGAGPWEAARGLISGRFTQFRLFSHDMGRAAFLMIASATAVMTAMMTGSVAHDEFGISLDTICTDALSAAGLFLRLACGSLLRRKK